MRGGPVSIPLEWAFYINWDAQSICRGVARRHIAASPWHGGNILSKPAFLSRGSRGRYFQIGCRSASQEVFMSEQSNPSGPDLIQGIPLDQLAEGVMLGGHVGEEPV